MAVKKTKAALKKAVKAKPVKKQPSEKVVSLKAAGVVKARKKTEKVHKPNLPEVIKQEEIKQESAPVISSEPLVLARAAESATKAEQEPAPKIPPSVEIEEKIPEGKELELNFPVSVKDLAVNLQLKPSQLIQDLMRRNIFVTINQQLSQEVARDICAKYGFRLKFTPDREEQLLSAYLNKDDPASLKLRSPVVTFMGHVDHGKTSLLDIIRKTNIADGEHGGITQHIGAYEVVLPKGKITFLDTPGHEAFTAMRLHGAHITDIVVLVVAADDGVMPQTVEAIDHARAAGVPIIVAINKVDKAQADLDRVKRQLSKLDLAPEEWQGKTITIEVSAKTGKGVDELLELILLEADMLELKANYQKPAIGVVIESRRDKNRGPLATLLVENGTLRLNDLFVCGLTYAKVKAMFNDRGQKIQEAFPGTPVEILGLSGLPEAGERFFVIADEKQLREVTTLRQDKEKKRRLQPVKRISLEDLHSQIQQGAIKELKIIIKADVSGSLEAVRDSLTKLEVSEVKFQVIHAGIGSINASDAMLANVTNALILGFHVQPDERAKQIIEQENIEVRTYNIIYELIKEIRSALEGLLEPKIKKVFLGSAQVRKVFKLSRSGIVAGCFVTKGKIMRSASLSLVRNAEVIFEGKISNLKRFKDDVKEIAEGFECGISLEGFHDYQEGDIFEAYDIQKIARKLG
ncbi:MAG: translation initiation factor IF-2 [Candidatus Omnitrophica bacterium]|nr:translation initiation factor IF-2 [Candidatus Omnitrophota bacterium]